MQRVLIRSRIEQPLRGCQVKPRRRAEPLQGLLAFATPREFRPERGQERAALRRGRVGGCDVCVVERLQVRVTGEERAFGVFASSEDRVHRVFEIFAHAQDVLQRGLRRRRQKARVREPVFEIVVGDLGICRGDRGLERRRRMGVGHVNRRRVIEQREKGVGGFSPVNQSHPRAGDVAVGVFGRGELVFDGGEIAAQCSGEVDYLRRGWGGLAAQVLIPDQVERGGGLERPRLQVLYQRDESQNRGIRRGGRGGWVEGR